MNERVLSCVGLGDSRNIDGFTILFFDGAYGAFYLGKFYEAYIEALFLKLCVRL